jgi:hypothetical protein
VYSDVYCLGLIDNEGNGWTEPVTIIYPKKLVQALSWKKNKLAKVDYWPHHYLNVEPTWEIYKTDHYIYDGNRLVKIEHNDGYYTQIQYDGLQYSKMEILDSKANVIVSAVFSYKDSKISKVVLEQNRGSEIGKAMQSKFLATFIPKELAAAMVEKSEESKISQGANTVVYTIEYTYSGDNVKEINTEIDDGFYREHSKTSFGAYDKKNNPFYNKLDYIFNLEPQYGVMGIYSKNNPLERIDTYPIPRTIRYSYIYEKNFPIEITWEVSSPETPTTISKEYYEYE